MTAFWICFHLFIGFLLSFDLYLFHRKSDEVSLSRSIAFSCLWILAALLFNYFVYQVMGADAGLQFFTGYLIEKSLSVDNLLIFLMIFTSFKISLEDQHRILFWGILGALVFRISLILLGSVLIREFHWMFYLLGLFLVATGCKFLFQREGDQEKDQIRFFQMLKRVLPFSEGDSKGAFFVREGGRFKLTSLFLILLIIEGFDIVFALDSIPAVFAISTDPFIVYTSNIFAILGLRSLYFVLVPCLNQLQYLKFGLAAILIFVGAKMLLSDLFPISLLVSLGTIVFILVLTAWISFKNNR